MSDPQPAAGQSWPESAYRARLRRVLAGLEINQQELIDVFETYVEELPADVSDAHLMLYTAGELAQLERFIAQLRRRLDASLPSWVA